MKCKVCDIEMVIGQAIKPTTVEDVLYVMPEPYIDNDNLEIIDVWKCPTCGHSEFIEQIEMNIKYMVKDKQVTFLYYRENELWYTTECGFEFPVPINDVGTGYMNAQDKAILYMRWIRKHLALIDDAKAET